MRLYDLTFKKMKVMKLKMLSISPRCILACTTDLSQLHKAHDPTTGAENRKLQKIKKLKLKVVLE